MQLSCPIDTDPPPASEPCNTRNPLPELKLSIADARAEKNAGAKARASQCRGARRVRGVIDPVKARPARVPQTWGPAENRGLYEACRVMRSQWRAFVRLGRNPLARRVHWTEGGAG